MQFIKLHFKMSLSMNVTHIHWRERLPSLAPLPPWSYYTLLLFLVSIWSAFIHTFSCFLVFQLSLDHSLTELSCSIHLSTIYNISHSLIFPSVLLFPNFLAYSYPVTAGLHHYYLSSIQKRRRWSHTNDNHLDIIRNRFKLDIYCVCVLG